MNRTVLIVEDEDSLRKTIALEFRATGWRVFESHHIDHAFKTIENEKIDIVVTDNRMPGGSGYDLLVRIKKAYRNLPVVLMTGFSDVNWEEIYDSGADEFLMKPFKLAALLAISERLLLPLDVRLQSPISAFDPAAAKTLTYQFSDWLQAERDGAFMLGRGGFFLKLAPPLPKEDSFLKLNITFTGGILRNLDGFGKVKWCRFGDVSGANGSASAGLGVEIMSLSEDSAKEFMRTIDMLQPQAYIPMGSRR